MSNVHGIFIAAVSLCLLGCSGDAGNPDLRKSAEQALVDGRAAFDQGQFDQAYEQLGLAIQGGLNADLYSEALVRHAVAAIHLGKFEDAQADFERLDQGATNMDQVFAAKSFLALKQGNKPEANRLWQQAVRENPKVKKYSP
jgi:tetratricopeptide (TPR) repeat protein